MVAGAAPAPSEGVPKEVTPPAPTGVTGRPPEPAGNAAQGLAFQILYGPHHSVPADVSALLCRHYEVDLHFAGIDTKGEIAEGQGGVVVAWSEFNPEARLFLEKTHPNALNVCDFKHEGWRQWPTEAAIPRVGMAGSSCVPFAKAGAQDGAAHAAANDTAILSSAARHRNHSAFLVENVEWFFTGDAEHGAFSAAVRAWEADGYELSMVLTR